MITANAAVKALAASPANEASTLSRFGCLGSGSSLAENWTSVGCLGLFF